MTRVDAALLLREIVARSLAVGMEAKAGIDVSEDYDEILIGPDDAAPLTLLVSEAVTNALKYVPQDRPGEAQIAISLKYTDPEKALLRVMNTAGGTAIEEGTGLGSRLIQAFARQLNGNLEISESDGTYALELSFPVPKADKVVYDKCCNFACLEMSTFAVGTFLCGVCWLCERSRKGGENDDRNVFGQPHGFVDGCWCCCRDDIGRWIRSDAGRMEEIRKAHYAWTLVRITIFPLGFVPKSENRRR